MTPIAIPDEYRAIGDVWKAAAAAVGKGLKNHAVSFLPAEGRGWVDTGIVLSEGQEITLLPYGRVWLSREADLAFGPNVALWYRVGSGLIARSSGNTVSFKASNAGTLHLITKPPGEWANRSGDLLPEYPHVGATGGLLVAILVWSRSADEGLRAFAPHDGTGTASAELARHGSERPLPKGWEALWRVGDTRMFSDELDEGRSVITCRCHNDAAILKHPVDVSLDDTVRLNWSWRVTTLPSGLGEDTLATHDYLSIAIEFDNGQDMTYLWSSRLPTGVAFRCPIPWWDKHETHIVRRTGESMLGHWIDESQSILEDYEAPVAGPLPSRIVGVWLIGLSPFQRQVGECAYREILLKCKTGSVWIGP